MIEHRAVLDRITSWISLTWGCQRYTWYTETSERAAQTDAASVFLSCAQASRCDTHGRENDTWNWWALCKTMLQLTQSSVTPAANNELSEDGTLPN